MKKNYILLVLLISLAYSTNTHAQTWTSINSNQIFGNYYQIEAITNDSSGNVWVGSFGGGVAMFNGSIWKVYKTSDGLISNAINAIAIDTLGNKWFATSIGVSKFDGVNWTSYTKSSTSNGLVNNLVYSIAVDLKNVIYCGTNSGLSKFDGTTWSWIPGSNTFINSIAVDTYNNKWFFALQTEIRDIGNGR